MKRLIATFLTFMLMLSIMACGQAEDISKYSVELDTSFLASFNKTASEWLSTSQTRSLLSIGLALAVLGDDTVEEDNILHIFDNDTYIMRDGLSLTLSGYTEDYIYLLTYTPYTGKANFTRAENPAGTNIIYAIEAAAKESADEYYKNNTLEIWELLIELANQLEK